jgi:hypothetical protein
MGFSRLPKLTTIDDPVADDLWSYEGDAGVQHVARVTIGRPAPISGDPNGDWYCPLRIEHRTPEILCMVGVGPVDALGNAMRVVSDHFHELRKVGPRARPLVKSQVVTTARITERELQDAFEQWGADRSGFLIAGAPDWLLRRGQPQARRRLSVGRAVEFTPDIVWDDADGTYVVELKSAEKNEPLAIAQAFFEAFSLGQEPPAYGLGRKPVPVIITRFNYWNRAALSFLLEEGLRWGREFYLEVDALEHGHRKWLWLDPPLAPLTPIARPPAASDEKTALRHWYRIGSCEAWFGTDKPLAARDGLLLRPAIPEARYAICAAVAGRSNEWLLWSGLPGERGEFSLLETTS